MLRRVPALRAVAAVAFAVLALAGTDAGAASLQVAPTSLSLPPETRAEGLWLSNSGTDPVRVQLRLFRWTQVDGRDVLEPTRDLVVSPPMQTLAAGQRQLVRLVRTGGAPPTAQQAYRVIVDELPDTDPGREGLQFVLRYSIPVFLLPPATQPAAAPAITTRFVTGSDGMAALALENRGTLHAQVADLAYTGSDGTARAVLPGLVGYVLPGQRMQWSLKAPATDFRGGRFSARINGDAAEQALPLLDDAH